MHNRARLVVGSFLTKDLGIDWRWGERWFMRLLIDGDEANNNGNWQWIASVGVDPAPFFRRIYNPARHMERYDPDGDYVRRYVPELREVPRRVPERAVGDAGRGAARGRVPDRRGLPRADRGPRASAAPGNRALPGLTSVPRRARYRRPMATAPPAVPSGPAHVAVVSFLAARAAPAGGFWIALAGGVALARVAERRGARLGFGASVAAMLETVAIIGPARIGIPLTQAATAPMLGRLEARGWRPLPQILACAAIRLVHNTATTAFFIWVITGGLDAYAGTYDAIGRRLGLEIGSADALVLTAVACWSGPPSRAPSRCRLPARPGPLGRARRPGL